MRWLRRRSLSVGDVPLADTYYLVVPGAGVTQVRLGRADGVEVVATVTAPRRWFVLFRAVDTPDGIHGQMVWEVDPATELAALRRRMRGRADAAPVVAGHQDVALYARRADAERHARGVAR